ncbi:MAG: DegT/DnrJ/EryC1/StrS family aminotransferase, partial [Acidimicrobiia bacterium]|nr:DegT/DnrJ/EryC1/StrS family aminotransferase [Acidimicrobiia bacterium]
GVLGLTLPTERPNTEHVYWRIAVQVDETVIAGGVSALAQTLKGLDIPAGPRYIQKPAFDCEVIRDQKTFGTSGWPFTLARPEAVAYDRDKYPGSYDGLAQVLVFPLNERYEDAHIDAVVEAVAKAVAELAIV